MKTQERVSLHILAALLLALLMAGACETLYGQEPPPGALTIPIEIPRFEGIPTDEDRHSRAFDTPLVDFGHCFGGPVGPNHVLTANHCKSQMPDGLRRAGHFTTISEKHDLALVWMPDRIVQDGPLELPQASGNTKDSMWIESRMLPWVLEIRGHEGIRKGSSGSPCVSFEDGKFVVWGILITGTKPVSDVGRCSTTYKHAEKIKRVMERQGWKGETND